MTRIPVYHVATALSCLIAGAALSPQTWGGPINPVPVPPAVFEENANNDGLPGSGALIGPGQADVVGSYCQVAQPSGCQTSEGKTLAAGIVAVANGFASGGAGNGAQALATAGIFYNFEVTGTNAPFVPLLITGAVTAAASGPNADATGEIQMSFVDGDGFEVKEITANVVANGIINPDPTPEALDLDFDFDQATNVLGLVNVTAECGAVAFPVIKNGVISDSGQGTCQASADPVISIDPAFLADHPGVTLELSANVDQSPNNGGPPGVPEPAAVWMLLAGVPLMIGLRGRRNPASGAS